VTSCKYFKINNIGHSGQSAGLPFVLFMPLIVFLLVLVIPTESEGSSEEFRGMWIVRHTLVSEDRILKSVELADRTNINALLVQVRGRGDAYYHSDLVPRAEDLGSETIDPLSLVIREAHQRGIEVHAWINVFLAWNPTDKPPSNPAHLLNRHPEWFMASADGIEMGSKVLGDVDLVRRGVEGRYLSPSVPEVRRHLLRVIREIIEKYDIDGIHLDYVRYPNLHYDYSLISRAEFTRKLGFDPLRVIDHSNGSAEDLRNRRLKVWQKWRTDQITVLVKGIRTLLRELKPDIQLSAAVKPDVKRAYVQHGQDWIRWINREMIDFVIPMFYTGSDKEIARKIEVSNQYVKRGRMFAGIGMYNQDARASVAQVEIARRAGLEGMVLYSYDSLVAQPDLAEALRLKVFERPSKVPHRKWNPKRAIKTR